MNQTTMPLPNDVNSRNDAVNSGSTFSRAASPSTGKTTRPGGSTLPAHLLSRSEVTRVRRLLSRVERLGDDGCYDDALSLMKFGLLISPDQVATIDPRHAGAFAHCGSPAHALKVN